MNLEALAVDVVRPALDVCNMAFFCLTLTTFGWLSIAKRKDIYDCLSLDRSLSEARKLPPRPSGDWIASVREALGLTLAEVGKHLRVPRQTVQKFDHAEATNRITLGSLRRIADAMGCDLIYVVVPKFGSFDALAERPTRERTAPDVKSVVNTMALEGQKPENASQLTEDEVQRRLNGKPKRQS